MSSSVDNRLAQFLKEGKDWDKKATSIPGVFLLKIPAYRGTSPSIAIEINKSEFLRWKSDNKKNWLNILLT